MGGPPSGPSVPKPRFTYSSAEAWPWNQPGWKATAPPVVGQYVLFFVAGMPPPGVLLAGRPRVFFCVQGGVEAGMRTGEVLGSRPRRAVSRGDERNVQGYSHCIPYGWDEFVMRLFPLDPGYEMRMCACTVAAATSAVNMLPSMASFFPCFTPVSFSSSRVAQVVFRPPARFCSPRNSLRGCGCRVVRVGR